MWLGSKKNGVLVDPPVNDSCDALAFSTLIHLPRVPKPTTGVRQSQLGIPDQVGIDCQVGEFRAWLDDADAEQFPIVAPVGSHLRRSKHIVAAQLGIDKRPGERSVSIDDSLMKWGWDANVIWVTQDHRVLDPAGRLLTDIRGQSPEDSAVIPFPLDARKRKSEMEVRLRNRMIDPPAGLLPIPGVDEIQMQSPADVARRALALFVSATRAESILGGQALDMQRMHERCPLGFAAMSEQERAFFSLPSGGSAQAECLQAADEVVWRYESLLTLQWALAMQFEMPWLDTRADLVSVTRLMIDLPDESIVEQARLRPISEILDAAELHWQAFQGIVEAHHTGGDWSNLLDEGAVCERLIGLVWILGLAPAPDWDSAVRWVERGCQEKTFRK